MQAEPESRKPPNYRSLAEHLQIMFVFSAVATFALTAAPLLSALLETLGPSQGSGLGVALSSVGPVPLLGFRLLKTQATNFLRVSWPTCLEGVFSTLSVLRRASDSLQLIVCVSVFDEPCKMLSEFMGF